MGADTRAAHPLCPLEMFEQQEQKKKKATPESLPGNSIGEIMFILGGISEFSHDDIPGKITEILRRQEIHLFRLRAGVIFSFTRHQKPP